MKSALKPKHTVLAVDDDEINLEILLKTAKDAGYNVQPFSSSEAAWAYLCKNPKAVDIALLDRMMPGVSGMELLGCMKRNHVLKHIPVILQTGDVGSEQMRQGLENGAYYYLTKPFQPEILVAILKAAENECNLREELVAQANAEHGKFLNLLNDGEFIIHNIAEARLLATSLSALSATPYLTARGLMELFFNAIEHGNLEVGFKKKHDCLVNNNWPQELAARLGKFQGRRVRVLTQRSGTAFHISVIDQGKGFAWQQYVSPNAAIQLNQPNGRGIAIANRVLGNLHYNPAGNEAYCSIGRESHLSSSVNQIAGLSATQ